MGGSYFAAQKHNVIPQGGNEGLSPAIQRATDRSNNTVNLPTGSVYTGERRNGKKHGHGF